MLCTCESRVLWTSIWLMKEVKSVSHPYPQQNILENWLSFVFNYSKGNKKATFKPNRNFIFPLKQFKTPTELSACSKPQKYRAEMSDHGLFARVRYIKILSWLQVYYGQNCKLLMIPLSRNFQKSGLEKKGNWRNQIWKHDYKRRTQVGILMCHAYVCYLIILIDPLKMNVNLTFFPANLKLVYQFSG